MKKILSLLGALCIGLVPVGALSQPAEISTTTTTNATVSSSASNSLSSGYDSIQLGMPYEAVYDALLNSPSLGYRGVPDVSLSPGRDEKIIEARGGSYIKRGIFQFRDNKLFTILLEFNPGQIDYFGLFTNFSERYGEPFFLSPEEVRWENATVRLVLEKPLTLKYIDRPVLEALQKKAGIEESVRERARADFIKKL